ncbi:sister chromatid cohesion protein PDS5 homolog B-A-like isoform X1 [Ornithodoros turicata]|uniref:sister chromatid cohesion protein PDS5 homolog B-A-like isoform X1 n=1 Tax=Ornithodoros turicata TaxID=34597 RepID=UPI003138E60B
MCASVSFGHIKIELARAMDVPYPHQVRPRMSDEQLHPMLTIWLTALQEMQECPPNVLPAWVIPVVRHLAGKEFVERTSGWRIHCMHATCLVLALADRRICVTLGVRPLRRAVKFVIQALGKLLHHDSEGYACYREMLEVICEKRVFVTLSSVGIDPILFGDLGRELFGVLNSNNVADLTGHILGLALELTGIPAVSEEVLHAVVSQLISCQKVHSYLLAERFLQTLPSELEPAVSRLLHHDVRDQISPDCKDHERVFAILSAVYCVRPSLTGEAISSLQDVVLCEDDGKRRAATRCLGKMLSEGSMATSYWTGSLVSTYLMRFDDISETVRLECATHTCQLLLRCPERLPASIAGVLKRRQWDPNMQVRLAIVKGIAEALKKGMDIDNDLLKIVANRVFDNEPEVRREAASALASLYRRNALGVSTTESRCCWVARPVLKLYLQGDAEDRAHVEKLLRRKLLRVTMESSYRMQCLLNLHRALDKQAQWAFSKLLKNSFRVLDLLRAELRMIGGATDASIEEKEELSTILIGLAECHTRKEIATRALVSVFNELSENTTLCDKLASALNPEKSSELVHLESLVSQLPLQRFAEKDTSVSIFHDLCISATCNMIGSRDARCLLGLLRQEPQEEVVEDNIHFVGYGASGDPPPLLKVLSSTFSASFLRRDVIDELFAMLSTTTLVEHALCAFTQIASELHENADKQFLKNLEELLEERVLTGTLKERKLAVLCLSRMAVNTERFFRKVVEDLQAMLTFESEHCREAILTIGHVARWKASYFEDTFADIFVVAVNTLVLDDRDANATQTAEAWCEYQLLSEKAKIKVECLKALVRFILGRWTDIHLAQKGFSILFCIVDGAENGNLTASNSEASWLQYVAATGVLRLCCCINYSHALTPQQFQRLAMVPRCGCLEVRLGVLKKLSRYVEAGRLPVQFLALFAHSAHERDATLRRWAHRALTRCVRVRQDQLQRKEEDNASRFMRQPDYMIPYAVHLLAHFDELVDHTCLAALAYIKRCFYFLLEPLMKHSYWYEPHFYVDLLETIKQTQDAQDPTNEMANLKLYAVCDVAVGVVISKGAETTRATTQKVALPAKLFIPVKQMRHWNENMYLTRQLLFTPPKRKGVDMSAFGIKRRLTSTASDEKSPAAEGLDHSHEPRSPAESEELRRSFHEQSVYSDYEAEDAIDPSLVSSREFRERSRRHSEDDTVTMNGQNVLETDSQTVSSPEGQQHAPPSDHDQDAFYNMNSETEVSEQSSASRTSVVTVSSSESGGHT